MITKCRHSFQNQQCSGWKVLVTFRQVVGNLAISDGVSIYDIENATEYPTRCLRFLIVTSLPQNLCLKFQISPLK